MKNALLITVLLIALLLIVNMTMEDAGSITMAWMGQDYTMTLAQFAFIILGSFMLFYLLIRLLIWIIEIPKRTTLRRNLNRQQKARTLLQQGFELFTQGQWIKAERAFIRGADKTEKALMHYLYAAHAAEKTGAHLRRDIYLAEAQKAQPESGTTIQLTRAQLMLHNGQFEQARAILERLQHEKPKQKRLLMMLAKLYEDMDDWEALHQLLPSLRKAKVYTKEGLLSVQERIDSQKLLATQSKVKLEEHWREIPKTLCKNPQLTGVYVDKLIGLNAYQQASQTLLRCLGSNWDDELATRLSDFDPNRETDLISSAEKLLKKYQDNPQLLQELGHLCLKAELWGKAEDYLKSSIALKPSITGYALLGRLHEDKGFNKKATDFYKKALRKKKQEKVDQQPKENEAYLLPPL